jgi:hypothetical protein
MFHLPLPMNTIFNQDISKWNTSSAVSFIYMLYNAESFTRDLSLWNVGSVTNCLHMFEGTASLDQDLCAWGPQILPHSWNSPVAVEEMYADSACLDPDEPMLISYEPTLGPFCMPCGDAEEAVSFVPSVSCPSVFAQENNNDSNLNDNKNKIFDDEQSLLPSVHTHESAARGVHIVLVMLVFFSLNF